MNYVFQFGVVVDNWPLLALGAWQTMELTLAAIALGTLLATACAFAQIVGGTVLRGAVRGYVEFFRNTPLLVQLFVIYFSLPGIGLRLDPWEAALLGMSINLGAYATEIIRGGIDAVPRGQVEAGYALGLSRFKVFRLVVLRQALRVAYPALASQYVLLMLGSSVVSAISAAELTGITNTLQSTTFRAFEFYFAATLLYLAMALAFRMLLGALFWSLFLRGRAA